jgi:hypothetical protein
MGIWTNYIERSMQLGSPLAVTLAESCDMDVNALHGYVISTHEPFTGADGSEWIANHLFGFTYSSVAYPNGLQCIQQAIIHTGGPSDTPECGVTPTE